MPPAQRLGASAISAKPEARLPIGVHVNGSGRSQSQLDISLTETVWLMLI